MAVTEDAHPPNSSNPNVANVLTHIDMSTLTQSELRSLSLLSNSTSTSTSTSTSDVLIPEINPSVFNESATTRYQTYSPVKPDAGAANSSASGGFHRHRFSHLTSSAKSLSKPVNDDHERLEAGLIVNFMKKNLGIGNSDKVESLEKVLEPEPAERVEIGVGEGKIKRARKRNLKDQAEGNSDEVSVEIVNKNGVVVDLVALESYDDPYGGEMRRRTAGLETEEELLEFLRGLEGKWCSRRRKRRIVDADVFGDVLPLGWKLIVALRRNGGRFSPYCRRYVSPTGEQLLSCNEASSYLRSYFGPNVGNLLRDSGDELQEEAGVHSANHAEEKSQDSISIQDMSHPTRLDVSRPTEDKNGMSTLDLDKLPDVEIHEIFECHQCNVTFHEKKLYLQHLASFHVRTIKRWETFSSISEAMIIRDRKYECQICHKVFEEKQRCNCHVGVHVRNTKRLSQEVPSQDIQNGQSASVERVHSGTSRMDALAAIAQSSLKEASSEGPQMASDDHLPEQPNIADTSAIAAPVSRKEKNLAYCPIEFDGENVSKGEKFPTKVINQQDKEGGSSPAVEQKSDDMFEHEELRFDGWNQGVITGQESPFLPDESMDLTSDAAVGTEHKSTVDSSSASVDMPAIKHIMTICVWCGAKFCHKAVGIQADSDSVGFMCPTCRAKISGQINELENSLSKNG